VTVPGQRPLPPLLQPGRQLADFIAGDNAELVERLRRCAADVPQARVLVTGATGTGKSHLLAAVAAAAGGTGHASVLLSARHGALPPAERLRSAGGAGVIAIDDVDACLGQRAAEESLLQVVNEARGLLLLATTSHVAELRCVLPDLRSRLLASEVFRLRPLDEAAQRQLVRRRAAAVGLAVDDAVLDYLMHRVARNAGGLAGIVDALDAASWQARRPLTIPLVRDVLQARAAR
jgi:DnaA family protein